MKKRKLGALGTLVIACASLVVVTGPQASQPASAAGSSFVSILTYNVSKANDSSNGTTWADRRQPVVDRVNAHNPGIFGLEEVREDKNGNMVSWLISAFSSEYGVAYPTDVNISSSAPNLIFYRLSKFTLLNHGAKRFQDVACADVPVGRSMTWARLKDKGTGQIYFVVVTHLTQNPAGTESCANVRASQVADLKSEIASVLKTNKWTPPIIVMGDLNVDNDASESTLDTLGAATTVTNGSDYTYTYNLDLTVGRSNGSPTINGNWPAQDDGTGARIDYIFRQSSKLAVQDPYIDTSRVQIGTQTMSPSDHYPVGATLTVVP